MEMKHSKGPWSFVPEDDKNYDDRIMSGDQVVCSFGGGDRSEPSIGYAPDDGDLALILASPELLHLVSTANNPLTGSHTISWQNRAKVIIEKVTK